MRSNGRTPNHMLSLMVHQCYTHVASVLHLCCLYVAFLCCIYATPILHMSYIYIASMLHLCFSCVPSVFMFADRIVFHVWPIVAVRSHPARPVTVCGRRPIKGVREKKMKRKHDAIGNLESDRVKRRDTTAALLSPNLVTEEMENGIYPKSYYVSLFDINTHLTSTTSTHNCGE